MQLSACSVPLICEPLTRHTLALAKNMYDHLSDLQLADYLTETAPADVDILIGSDQYWQLVTGEVRRGDSGPMPITHDYAGCYPDQAKARPVTVSCP